MLKHQKHRILKKAVQPKILLDPDFFCSILHFIFGPWIWEGELMDFMYLILHFLYWILHGSFVSDPGLMDYWIILIISRRTLRVSWRQHARTIHMYSGFQLIYQTIMILNWSQFLRHNLELPKHCEKCLFVRRAIKWILDFCVGSRIFLWSSLLDFLG